MPFLKRLQGSGYSVSIVLYPTYELCSRVKDSDASEFSIIPEQRFRYQYPIEAQDDAGSVEEKLEKVGRFSSYVLKRLTVSLLAVTEQGVPGSAQ